MLMSMSPAAILVSSPRTWLPSLGDEALKSISIRSLAELYAAFGGDKYTLWKQYCTYGGLPYLAMLNNNARRAEYLTALNQTLYLRDLVERNRIVNIHEFVELMKVMASGIGSPCNPNKIANTFVSTQFHLPY